MKNYSNFCRTQIELGVNLLSGITPEFLCEGGYTYPSGRENEKPQFEIISDESFFDRHTDIWAEKFSLIYDLGSETEFDRIYFNSMRHPYQVGKFEIYASNNRDTLFDLKNRLANVNNEKTYCDENGKSVQSCFDFQFEEMTARYIAFRQLTTNDVEKLTRFTTFGIYSEKVSFSRCYLKRNLLDDSIISGLVPIGAEANSGFAALTDGIVFDDDFITEVSGKLAYKLENAKNVDRIVIIGEWIENIVISITDSKTELFVEFEKINVTSTEIEQGRYKTEIELENSKSKKILGIDFGERKIKVDQICAFSCTHNVRVNLESVINDDFLGIGANAIPMHLFPGTRSLGYDEACFELEKCRINRIKPAVLRVWFQPDWFIMDEADYYNRRYVFNSLLMRAIYKELDAYKAAGVLVELNYGWKISSDAQSWFSFDDVEIKTCSAPKDLNQFAISCADLVKELVVERGYTNIKYLSFFNEAECARSEDVYDFAVPDFNPIPYWKEMAILCDRKLRELGIRDCIEIWGAENSGLLANQKGEPLDTPILDWIKALSDDNSPCDRLSLHFYEAKYQTAKDSIKVAKEFSNGKKVCITEFGIYKPVNEHTFDSNNVSVALGLLNGGADCALFWYFSGCYLEENFKFDGGFWHMPMKGCGGINAVNREFYELSPIMNYVPAHSEILKVATEDDKIHAAAAITENGDITVMVEADKSVFGKKINIHFSQPIGRKFYKHIYNFSTTNNGKTIVPPSMSEIYVENRLCDELDTDYTFAVYTTAKPIKQVVPDEIEVTLKPGEEYKFAAQVVDGDGNEEIKWSICDCNYNFKSIGSITEDGLYRADLRVGANAVERRIAIKAQIESGEYAVCLVNVIS